MIILRKIDTTTSGITNHSELNQLDYISSGHTGFAQTVHNHTESNITDLDKYTQTEVDTISGSLSSEIDLDISTHGSSDDHDGRYYTESEVDSLIASASGTTNHSDLDELDYASSGHTGFQPAGDYTTDSELTTVSSALQENIDDKADISHYHDGRYYTESEVDTISGSLQIDINNKPDTLLELIDTPSSYANGLYLKSTVDGTEWATASGGGGVENHSELNELSYVESGHTGFSPTSHSHAESDISDLDKYTTPEVDTISGSLSSEIDSDISTHTSNTDAHHAESHTITSHSDITDATGAELEELTGAGDTSLHIHDGRYYTESEVDTISGSLQINIDGKSDTSHNHNLNDLSEKSYNSLTDKPTIPTDFYSREEVDTISGSLSTEIDSDISTHASNTDAHHAESHTVASHSDTTATGAELETLTDGSDTTLHIHDNRYYTESEVDTISGSLSSEIDSDISTHSSSADHDDRYYTETELDAGQLDDRYYTESEVDTISGSLSTEIDNDISTHSSDTTSVHGITDTSDLALKSGNVNQFSDITSAGADIEDAVSKKHDESHTITSHSDITDATGANLEELTGGGDTTLHDHDGISENTAARHAESHTITSHSDIVDATGSQIEELTGGSETSLHTHDSRYYTEPEVDTISGSLQTSIDAKPNTLLELTDTPSNYDNDKYLKSTVDGTEWATVSGGGSADHNIADHLDTSATGAELDTLTNNSIADTLHRHSELVASDGSPDPALSIDNNGLISTNGAGVQINSLGSGNRDAYIDLISDDTYTDYGLKILKNAGANGNSVIYHRGTGNFNIITLEESPMYFYTHNTLRVTLASDGKLSLQTGTGINEFSTDTTLSGNSDDVVPTEKAVKTYIDAAGGVSTSNDNVWSETQLYNDNSLTCASTTTWDMETYQNTYLLLTENTTLSGTVPAANSGYYTVLIKNNGSYTLTLDDQFLTSEGESLENTTTSGSYDLLGVYLNNGLLFATMSTNFS